MFSFDLKFKGAKRTAFYRRLFGYSGKTKRVARDGSVRIYTHSSLGLLSGIPHIKLGKSVIAVPIPCAGRLDSFFLDPAWQPMELHTFDAILPADKRFRAMEEALDRPIEIGAGERAGLSEEIGELAEFVRRGERGEEFIGRARRAIRAVEELMGMDWSDNGEFSRLLEARVMQVKKGM